MVNEENINFNSKISLDLATKLKNFILSKKILIDFQGPDELKSICNDNDRDFTKIYLSGLLGSGRFGRRVMTTPVKEAVFSNPMLNIVINDSGFTINLTLRCTFSTLIDSKQRTEEIKYVGFFVF